MTVHILLIVTTPTVGRSPRSTVLVHQQTESRASRVTQIDDLKKSQRFVMSRFPIQTGWYERGETRPRQYVGM
ncbi:hypothetical protein L207DRAFT_520279 [Hyaloscypha variabilis F]|uniref:Uncharacterized protein n=1 Tax=Hyaloscypha variabilis (strain UAMH 11265 / GT02V1 / F) TaxID=1149755 RepID=A0A2J6QW29_HYAVF|nr:hypothetical protein L207DRAFT_520279 [Hyaloscypha variabilis F]